MGANLTASSIREDIGAVSNQIGSQIRPTFTHYSLWISPSASCHSISIIISLSMLNLKSNLACPQRLNTALGVTRGLSFHAKRVEFAEKSKSQKPWWWKLKWIAAQAPAAAYVTRGTRWFRIGPGTALQQQKADRMFVPKTKEGDRMESLPFSDNRGGVCVPGTFMMRPEWV